MDFSGSAAASPARRFDGVPAGQWEILERQRQDLQQRREQLELAARRRAAAQEAARVQKVKNLQKRLVDLDKMQALARKRNSQLLADVMDLQNSAMNQRPEASTAQACLHEELRKFAAYVHNGREKWAQDRAQRRRAAARDQALSPNGAARAREREGAAGTAGPGTARPASPPSPARAGDGDGRRSEAGEQRERLAAEERRSKVHMRPSLCERLRLRVCQSTGPVRVRVRSWVSHDVCSGGACIYDCGCGCRSWKSSGPRSRSGGRRRGNG